MPDGKRNSLSSEGEKDGVNCYYDDELHKATGIRRKLPLNHNSRTFINLSDRLLKTMVANEIKKTLDGEDNKKLVAHHLPVLHAEGDTESDMTVVGVVLSPKQIQNEEVLNAIDILQRNGVRCVHFTLKDSLQNGDKKDDNNVQPYENGNSSSIEELLENFTAQQANENSPSSELKELVTSQKKVSSPTVSTTSDYASPPPVPDDTVGNDDVANNLESFDSSCTSTTPNALNLETSDVGTSNKQKTRKGIQRRNRGRKPTQRETSADIHMSEPSTPPVLLPQISDSQNLEAIEEDKGNGDEDCNNDSLTSKLRSGVDSSAIRRKKRRKRMYPYLSRKKSRSKKKKEELSVSESANVLENTNSKESVVSPSIPVTVPKLPSVAVTKNLTKEVDPYEFEDSDFDNSTQEDTFKTPAGRNVPINRASSRKKNSKSMAVSSGKKCPTKSSKRSPRKRLTFSKSRAFSPDITDHANITLRQHEDVRQKNAVRHAESSSEDKFTPLESCVQPISTAFCKDTAQSLPGTHAVTDDIKLVLPPTDNPQREFSQSAQCDHSIRTPQVKPSVVEETLHDDRANEKDSQVIKAATQTPNVQEAGSSQFAQKDSKNPTPEFLVPAPPDDSLHDTPDSMQLRRSSFYSSISRNVRTNLEKYLDGRPPDLKPVKRSKKIKNGFLLHHGDNFPDDPEAPYRLHLATQVLLKLNKRRVKCKPKEDKGKSLLSYLKLQPKRVSRIGKNSKVSSTENNEDSSTKEATSVFSGEWTVPRKYVCNICGQVENAFWDIVMHKGEVHPGIVVTHVELSDDPPAGFRRPPSPRQTSTLTTPPPCTKCGSSFANYGDLHWHIFECAGNASVLNEGTSVKVAAKKKKSKRKRGFKRRISGLPKKNASKNPAINVGKSGEIVKRRNSEVFKCEFCTREFKTEGWLKNHISLSHSLPISIPLNKLSLPTRASINSSRRYTAQVAKPTKQLCRES